ncbi:MAG: HAD family hydrolase [Phycisphaerae bacterium]
MARELAGTAVVMDLDDTLTLERDYVRSGYCVVGVTLRQQTGRSDLFEQWLWQRFLSGQAGGAFNALSEEFDLGLSDERILELVKVYREHRPLIEPVKGVTGLLRELRQGGARLGLLSDGFLPAQEYKLEAVGLAHAFDRVLFTESLGRECWKPSPAAFERIAADLETLHERCIYVGDNPAKDFVAPNALGWRTVQVRLEGQIHAEKPVADGGRPGTVVWGVEELRRELLD